VSASADSLTDHIDQNIEAVVAFQRREWEQTTASQRYAERVGRWIGRPVYLVGILSVSVLWVALNVALRALGHTAPDPFPFEMLQGVLSLAALVTTTIVLIAQNRQTKLEQQHTHLGLQVNLLTEQKVTKLIHLIEELRHDLPMVRDRLDPQAEALQERADTLRVLSAIEQGGLTEGSVSGNRPADNNPAAGRSG
jgi:uncharacterized membrane protein